MEAILVASRHQYQHAIQLPRAIALLKHAFTNANYQRSVIRPLRRFELLIKFLICVGVLFIQVLLLLLCLLLSCWLSCFLASHVLVLHDSLHELFM